MNDTKSRVAIAVLESAVVPQADVVAVMPADERLSDEAVMQNLDMALEAKAEAVQVIDAQISRWRNEILRRLRERGARALPHPDYECERKDEYSSWDYDIPTLQEAAPLLNDEERAKILKWIDERITVDPAHWEPGHPKSIQALIDKYSGTKVAHLLEKARQRKFIREVLVFKRRAQS